MLRIDKQRERSRETKSGSDRGFSKSQRRDSVRRRKSRAGAQTCGASALLNREEHFTNPGRSVISPGNRASRNSSCTRRIAFSRLAKSLGRVDLPAAILPHKKINFAEVFMPSNDLLS